MEAGVNSIAGNVTQVDLLQLPLYIQSLEQQWHTLVRSIMSFFAHSFSFTHCLFQIACKRTHSSKTSASLGL
jgi:hypothetical protein